jgi:D-alanyl-D-alanine carboxypeptidase (penicillin-binding protein 5/6)
MKVAKRDRKSMLIRQIQYSIVFLLTLFTSLVHAAPALIPAPPSIAAKSYILMDGASGDIIIEDNANERLPPASLTKMMTAYITEYEIARGNINLKDEVLVSVKAWRTGGSKMFIKEGSRVPLVDLLRGIVIQSGNDASIAVAEHIAGSEGAFADIMNQHAGLLGMTDTHFQNATGLPMDEHYSSARDLALLAKAIIYKFPEQYPIYAEKYFTYNDIRQPNRNRLLWRDKSVDGLKTGHTEDAGYCMVASAMRDGMRLIAVVMGTSGEEARARETQKLLSFGFRYYDSVDLYQAGQKLIDGRVWAGVTDNLPLGIADAVTVTIPKGQKENIQASIEMNATIKAPVSIGDELGRIKVMLNETTLVDKPLVALQGVDEAGFFKRIWDMIKLFFAQLFAGE